MLAVCPFFEKLRGHPDPLTEDIAPCTPLGPNLLNLTKNLNCAKMKSLVRSSLVALTGAAGGRDRRFFP